VLKRPGATIHAWRIVAGVEVVAVRWSAGLRRAGRHLDIRVLLAGRGRCGCRRDRCLGAGAITFVVSGAMPARTKDGAMLAAMLRRIVGPHCTIKQAKSLDQVSR